jgi:hypothetical protein
MDVKSTSNSKNKPKENPAFHPYEIIRKVILPFWPVYLICLTIAFLISKFKLQSEMPIFEVGAKVVLHQDNDVDKVMMQELGIKEPQNSIENEIQILKSTRVSTEVTKRLGAYTRIIQIGDISKAAMPFTYPIRFKAAMEDSIKPFNIIFRFDEANQKIILENRSYSLVSQKVLIQEQIFQMTVDADRLDVINMNNDYSLQVLDIPTSAQLISDGLNASKVGENTSILSVSFQDLVVSNAEMIVNEALDI